MELMSARYARWLDERGIRRASLAGDVLAALEEMERALRRVSSSAVEPRMREIAERALRIEDRSVRELNAEVMDVAKLSCRIVREIGERYGRPWKDDQEAREFVEHLLGGCETWKR